MESSSRIDTRRARVSFPDGRVAYYGDQKLAYAVWLALPTGTRAAFRGANDLRPVYPWDYEDAPATEAYETKQTSDDSLEKSRRHVRYVQSVSE